MKIFSCAIGALLVGCALVGEATSRAADIGAARIEQTTSTSLLSPAPSSAPGREGEDNSRSSSQFLNSKKVTHWAYVKPARPEPPTVKSKKWPRNPIDNFVLARLEREKLTPAKEADRATLIRRLSLDLTGLPPTVAEVEAFEKDRSPQAYDNLVDRLLASPHYGERMARLWLDLARYADSNGYHIDTRRSMWPYRDWVIRAFNRNLPFDQFTIEQIAGDLLPNATEDQRVATGFHRNTMFNEEGGIDPEEFRVAAVVDRVNTTAAVWLGTTLGCAQCHNHKYDPFTQKEYYRFYAIFNNTTETGGGTGTSQSPLIEFPTAQQETKLQEMRSEIVRLEASLTNATPEILAAQVAWEKRRVSGSNLWTMLDPSTFASAQGASLTRESDLSILSGGKRPDTDTYTVTADTNLKGITAVRLEILTDESLPLKGPGRHDNGNPVLTEFRVQATLRADPAATKPVALQNPTADFSQVDWPVAKAIDGKPETGWAISPEIGKTHLAVFETKEAVGFEGGTTLTFTLEQKFGQGALIGRARFSVSTDPPPIRAEPLPESISRVLATAADQRSEAQKSELTTYYRTISPQLSKIKDTLAELKTSEKELLKQVPTTLVMQEKHEPRKTKIQVRGNFLNEGEPVSPGFPAVLDSPAENQSVDRLVLARWLVDPENPLAARVLVNRFWELHFGNGLVKTMEDFGSQGERPSHPELLDWLACEFMSPTASVNSLNRSTVKLGGAGDDSTIQQFHDSTPCPWDMKALHKLIVTSATYRQASRVEERKLEVDPFNRLLSRGARFRMEAEMIRDNTLAISGLLNRKIGGPSVFPYQPAGLWVEIGNKDYGNGEWIVSEGEELYRRGVYTFWRRSIPYPAFVGFDAPSRQHCTAQRPRSNTPLQALTTLNDPSFFGAACALAQRLMKEGGKDVEPRVTYGFRLCLARPPTAKERARLTALFEQQLANFKADGKAAETLAKLSQSPAAKGLDANELAAWTIVANVLLNLDGTITME